MVWHTKTFFFLASALSVHISWTITCNALDSRKLQKCMLDIGFSACLEVFSPSRFILNNGSTNRVSTCTASFFACKWIRICEKMLYYCRVLYDCVFSIMKFLLWDMILSLIDFLDFIWCTVFVFVSFKIG